MLHNLPALVKAAVAICLLTLNTLFWVPVLLLVALVKLLMPWQSMRLLVDPLLIRIAERWISGNSGWMRLTQRLKSLHIPVQALGQSHPAAVS